MLAHDLRRHVAWSYTENFQYLATSNDDREAEVDEFDLSAAFLDENVVKFDVSVHYVVLM